MGDWFDVAVSMQVMHEMMRSCESCHYRQAEYLVYETFVCVECAEVAR